VSEPFSAVLAIDGGNSKTEVALISADGRLLAHVRGGGSNWQLIGRQEAFGVLRELVQAAARAAGAPAGDALVARHTSACLAGADLADEEEQLTEIVQAQGWTSSSSVVNDTFAVLRAGLDDGAGERGPGEHGAGEHGAGAHAAGAHAPAGSWGIGVTCGAGINCVGVGPDGATTRFLALGHVSGDWGGGGDLAREALWWAARAEDGRGPQTELRTAVPAHFGMTEVRDVTIGRYREKISRGDLHGLAPVLFEVAGRGDLVARNLVLRQADEIAGMASAAARRLGLADAAMPVVLGGSILTARDPLLTARLTERLAAALPAATPRIVDVPPVAGAALLGLDRVGAAAGAAQRLRACYQDLPRGGEAAAGRARAADRLVGSSVARLVGWSATSGRNAGDHPGCGA
jgi:N-acetylglucosamine kinase-like BadF-type ATPase